MADAISVFEAYLCRNRYYATLDDLVEPSNKQLNRLPNFWAPIGSTTVVRFGKLIILCVAYKPRSVMLETQI